MWPGEAEVGVGGIGRLRAGPCLVGIHVGSLNDRCRTLVGIGDGGSGGNDGNPGGGGTGGTGGNGASASDETAAGNGNASFPLPAVPREAPPRPAARGLGGTGGSGGSTGGSGGDGQPSNEGELGQTGTPI